MIFGAHISLSKGLLGTIDLAQEIGATSMQFFSGNPRSWRTSIYKEEEALEFKRLQKKEGLGPVFLHSPYLINLASQNQHIRTSSITSLEVALEEVTQIEARGVITHLGSSKGKQTREEGIERVVKAIEQIFENTSGNLILENSAGAGQIVGGKIEELAKIIKKVDSSRLGICLDTAHLHAAGYNITSKEKLDKFLNMFDKLIGFGKLKAVHLNDSKSKLGSKLDRHANIGQGTIGKQGFKNIVNHEALNSSPGIIETPDITQDDKNLKLLKKLST